MKNRRMAILLGIFALIVFVIVLSSTVFSLGKVEVSFQSTTYHLNNKENDIITSGEFNYGKSIFLINRKNYIKNLEKQNPYLKVLGLEVVFPNKIIIHAIERSEMFAIKLSNNTYALVDEDLKVLELKSTFINTNENAILLENSAGNFPVENAVLGEVLKISTVDFDVAKNIASGLQEWDFDLSILRGNIKDIKLNYEQSHQLLINMRQGVQIIVKQSHKNLSDKLQIALSLYESQEVDISKGVILIVEDAEGEITAGYYS